jgi:DMSO/TMAO reductase YedYZ molybdopterin-dependent catalytic subunit
MVKRRWLAALAIALISAAAAAIALAMPATSAGTTGQAKADAVALTLTGKDGTVRTYTLADLKARTTADQGFYEGYAGFVNSANILTPVHPIEGVRLSSLLADAGYDGTSDVVVSAIDGYPKLLSSQVVQGQGVVTYSDVPPYPQTALPAGVSLTAVVAYAYKAPDKTVDDGTPWIDELAPPMGDGPLRLWFALDTKTTPGYVVDGDWIVKWVNQIRVTGTAVQEWTVNVKGPTKAMKLTRKDFESCTAPHCHGQTTVKLNDHSYQGLPLYFLVGKVDDNKAMNNWGDFNARLAAKGYWIDVRNGKRKISVSSKLIAGRTQKIILAWKLDGKELSGANAPLWLIGPKLKSAQRIPGIKSITLRGVPK